jgi:hypothetical protein
LDSIYWARIVRSDIHSVSGRNYQHLFNELEKMDVEALRDLHRLMQDVQQEIQNEKRSFRMFPGGPKFRM